MDVLSLNSRKNFFQRIHNKYNEDSLVRSFLSVLELFDKNEVLGIVKQIFSENKNIELLISMCESIDSFYIFDHLWDAHGIKFRGTPDFGIVLNISGQQINIYCEAKKGNNKPTFEQLKKYLEKISEKENSFLIALSDYKAYSKSLVNLPKEYSNRLLFIDWDSLFKYLKSKLPHSNHEINFLLKELFEYKEYKETPSQVIFDEIFLESLSDYKTKKYKNIKRAAYKGNIFDNAIRGFMKILEKNILAKHDVKIISSPKGDKPFKQHLYKSYFEIKFTAGLFNSIRFEFNIHSGVINAKKPFEKVKEKFGFYIYPNPKWLTTVPRDKILQLLGNFLDNSEEMKYFQIEPDMKKVHVLVYIPAEKISWSNPNKLLTDLTSLWSELILLGKGGKELLENLKN